MMFNNINVHVGKNVKLGINVRIGDNTIIYDNVEIGDNTVVCSNCILGEPTSAYYSDSEYKNNPLIIGKNGVIRSNTIIYSGTTIGNGLQTGHHTIIRENNTLGNGCVVGAYCNILSDCKIGNGVHFHSYDSIAEMTEVGDFCYFFPFVTVTADPTPPSDSWIKCAFGEFSVIASNAFVMPGTVVGRHCFVTAQSTCKGIYDDFSFIIGNPAQKIYDVRKVPIINKTTKRRQYPWPYNFERNMPWEGIGFEKWLELNDREL